MSKNDPSPAHRPAGILAVDDEPNTLTLLDQLLRRDFSVHCAQNGSEALALLQRETIGVIVADQRMPGMSGTELLRQVALLHPETVRILLTAYADTDILMEAINAGGVHRYISKPWDNRELLMTARAAMETYTLRRRNALLLEENVRLVEELRQANAELERENLSLKREVHRAYGLENIIGVSPVMKQVLRLVEKAIESSATVLIDGETGTGKEVIARAIHYNGPRRAMRFVAENCAALPESLLESALFGHVRGAFTGAFQDHRGLFEAADGGTIFLDEIGDMPMPMQVKLLRALEQGEIRRVGSDEPIRVDVRLISATHRDLRAEVEAGKFRRDLYYRLDIFRIHLPPLRERDGDVVLLARHFFTKYNARSGKNLTGLTTASVQALSRYHFPGNVRELENEIERAVALANPGEPIDVHLLSRSIAASPGDADLPDTRANLHRRMQEIERRLLSEELIRHGHNRTHTAATLGISVRALQKKIVQLGITE